MAHTPFHKDEGSLDDFIRSAMPRRRALWLLGGGAMSASLLACGGSSGEASAGNSSSSSSSNASSAASTSSASGSCTVLPEETNGPYPADGSNSLAGSPVNILTQSGVVRRDIRTSIGAYTGTAEGARLDLTITVRDAGLGCQSLAGYAVYIWHCTADGAYSLYSSGHTSQNYLRGVQVTDDNGQVTFTTIFPGCYTGRMPHIHVEVFASLSAATSRDNAAKTTQFAFDRNVCQNLYTTSSLYGSSVTSLAGITFATDNVFRDDSAAELAASTVTISGDASSGYTGTVTLTVE